MGREEASQIIKFWPISNEVGYSSREIGISSPPAITVVLWTRLKNHDMVVKLRSAVITVEQKNDQKILHGNQVL